MVKVDFTKMRLNSRFNGRKIEKCPVCGKKGQISRYRNGNWECTHYARIEFGFLVSDSRETCYFKNQENTERT